MQKFSKTLHGYNPDEVNKFLDDVISQVEKMIESNQKKNNEIIKLKNELDKIQPDSSVIEKAKKYDDLSETLNKAILLAQDTGEHIRKVAKQERNLILEEAKKNASVIINDALVRSEKIEYQATMLRKNIISFKRKLRANLEEQIRLVDEIEVLDDIKE